MEIIRAPVNFVNGEFVGREALVSAFGHDKSYATGLIEGISILLSIDGKYLCIRDLRAHAGRHLRGIDHFQAGIEDEMVLKGPNFQHPLSIDETYRLAREEPDKFPIEILVRGKNRDLIPLNLKTYEKTIIDVVNANFDVTEENFVAIRYLRPILSFGSMSPNRKDGGMGVDSSDNALEFVVLAMQWPEQYMGGKEGQNVFTDGVKVYIPPHDFIRADSRSDIKKTVNYAGLRTRLRNYAKRHGFHDALILGIEETQLTKEIVLQRKVITEFSGANALIILDGVIRTPEKSNLILPGISRDNTLSLVEILASIGVLGSLRQNKVIEGPITKDEALASNEIVASGSAAQITPCVSVDGKPIGNGEAGSVAKALQAAYFYLARGEPCEVEGHQITQFVDRVTKIEIPENKKETVYKQLGVPEDQKFDKRFKPISKDTKKAAEQLRIRRKMYSA